MKSIERKLVKRVKDLLSDGVKLEATWLDDDSVNVKTKLVLSESNKDCIQLIFDNHIHEHHIIYPDGVCCAYTITNKNLPVEPRAMTSITKCIINLINTTTSTKDR